MSKRRSLTAAGQVGLAVAVAILMLYQDYPTGHIIALGLILLSAVMTLNSAEFAIPSFIGGLAVGWYSILANLPHIPAADEVKNNCNGCLEIGTFFAIVAKMVIYGGIGVGLAASMVVLIALIGCFRKGQISKNEASQ